MKKFNDYLEEARENRSDDDVILSESFKDSVRDFFNDISKKMQKPHTSEKFETSLILGGAISTLTSLPFAALAAKTIGISAFSIPALLVSLTGGYILLLPYLLIKGKTASDILSKVFKKLSSALINKEDKADLIRNLKAFKSQIPDIKKTQAIIGKIDEMISTLENLDDSELKEAQDFLVKNWDSKVKPQLEKKLKKKKINF